MSDPRHDLGRRGEQAAEHFLHGLGFKTLARRFNTPSGELDLVMLDGSTIVFVEVKTQKDTTWLDPQDRVTGHKQARLFRAAKWYIVRHRLDDRPLRFDVVAVVMSPEDEPRITHIADAFAPENW